MRNATSNRETVDGKELGEKNKEPDIMAKKKNREGKATVTTAG